MTPKTLVPCKTCGKPRPVSSDRVNRAKGHQCRVCVGTAPTGLTGEEERLHRAANQRRRYYLRKGIAEPPPKGVRIVQDKVTKVRIAVPRKPDRAIKAEPAERLKVSAHKHTAPPKTYTPKSQDECGYERGDGSVCARMWPCGFHGDAS